MNHSLLKYFFFFFFWACPLATLGVGLRLQVRSSRLRGYSRKKSLQARFFAPYPPKACYFTGFPAAPSRSL
ncbi:MAG TPA: hypothetical protein P5215_00165 [Bacteroidales bacterium]|nr:hypothetical protein [Bacteroidales bacterium]